MRFLIINGLSGIALGWTVGDMGGHLDSWQPYAILLAVLVIFFNTAIHCSKRNR